GSERPSSFLFQICASLPSPSDVEVVLMLSEKQLLFRFKVLYQSQLIQIPELPVSILIAPKNLPLQLLNVFDVIAISQLLTLPFYTYIPPTSPPFIYVNSLLLTLNDEYPNALIIGSIELGELKELSVIYTELAPSTYTNELVAKPIPLKWQF
ncbi:MAG: hypothetical protein EZS28_055859, partial [Streblomastix strix]